MTEEQLKKLREFREKYYHAIGICDPIEFQKRQQILFYAICDYILKPLEEYEDSRIQPLKLFEINEKVKKVRKRKTK